MRHITLGKTGLSTSVIGYGCAGLMRPAAENDRQKLLMAAFDAGIRHFDVARYYGHGQSEAVLGRFITNTGCRDDITITTKFGMNPPSLSGSSRGRMLMNVARRVASLHPAVRRMLSARAGSAVKRNCFDVESASKSLETSLRELQTDRIDLFLLHEACLEDCMTDGLLEFLENSKQAGKILDYGLGSEFSLVAAVVEKEPSFARVIQIANCLGEWNLHHLPENPDRLVNTHGALKVLPALAAGIESSSPEVRRKLADLGADGGVSLAGMVLALAVHENHAGVTLFSSTHPDRIKTNVQEALKHSSRSEADWEDFKKIAEGVLKENEPSPIK